MTERSAGAGLIDVHCHFTTSSYVAQAKAAGWREPDGMPEEYWPRWNADEHLALMDELHISRSMLSMSSPGVYFGGKQQARALAREVNLAGAEIVRARPDRFGFFASVPLPDIDGSRR